MAYETIIAQHVKDELTYQKYLQAITPLLKAIGAGFRYDFVVNKVIRAEAKHKITRVFALFFESKESKETFFASKDYLEARAKYYTPSVGEFTTIAEYEK